MIFIYSQEIISIINQFSHDAFFHYLVTRHSEIRLLLCQQMISERVIVSTTVENSILYSSVEAGKKYVLDIVAKDDQEDIYNIEMQCYRMGEDDLKRFQVYGFRLSQNEAKKGKNYKDVRPVRQLIINNSDPIKGLDYYIHHFKFYDQEHGVSLPHNLNEITIVQLAYLDMENIDIKVFDELMYLFKYNRPYDKIKVDKNIMEAIEMHESYKGSNEWILAAERERDEMARQSDLEKWEEAKKGLEQWEEAKKDLEQWEEAKKDLEQWEEAKKDLEQWTEAKKGLEQWAEAKKELSEMYTVMTEKREEISQMDTVMTEKKKKLFEIEAKLNELEEKYKVILEE